MKTTVKKLAAMCMTLCLCAAFSACSVPGSGNASGGGTDGSVSRTVYAMDISISLTAFGDGADEALKKSEEELHRIDDLLSVTKENSQIAMLNSRNSNEISDETFDVINESVRMSRLTGGSFDISIYPVVRAWGFTTGGEYRIPGEAEISELLTHVGADKFSLESTGDRAADVNFTDDRTMLDTGAITKGYASDRINEIFDSCGVESAIISLGGNVLAKGSKPDGELWHVAVQDPSDPDNSYAGLVAVKDRFLVTSGGYQRYFDGPDGHRYIHIMDPSTGHPVENDLASVTIVSESGTEADALSTALFVKGLKGAEDFWKNTGDLEFEMILISTDGKIHITEGLADCFDSDAGAPEVISKEK